jgi:geranylgeranyl diphosphate synthase type I
MIQGQCLDLEFEASTGVTSHDYLQMIACKTGALIRSGLEMGALLAIDDPIPAQAFSHFGSYLGQVFQIRDDFLGIWGDVSTTGKAAGNDIVRRKKSFPVVYALSHARGQSRRDLLEIYGRQELDEDDVARVLVVLDEVGAQEESQKLIDASADEALHTLEEISLPSWAREEAEGLVDFLARREY